MGKKRCEARLQTRISAIRALDGEVSQGEQGRPRHNFEWFDLVPQAGFASTPVDR